MTGTQRIPHLFLATSLMAMFLIGGLLLAPTALADETAEAPAAKAKVAKAAAAKKAAKPRTPMLWEVDTKPKIYLFGTIHLGDPRVLAHPPVVEKALEKSQALYVEIDLNPEALMKLMPLMRLPEGESLATILPPKVRERMRALFMEKGMPEQVLDALDSMQIWAMYLQLQTLDVDPALMAQALDKVLFENAQKAGKLTGALETMDEQIDIFRTLTRKEQIRLLDESITAIERARKAKVKPIEQLIELYLTGDADKLLNAMMADMDKGDELSKKLMKRMLDDRNVNMVERMLKKAQGHPDKTTFVAVGTGHYPGTMGIIELLRRTGFRVRQLKTLADMDKPWPLARPASSSSRCAPRRAKRMIRIGPFCVPDPCAR